MKYNPFHPHCGPFNSVNDYISNNEIDETCRQHDMKYDEYGKDAYLYYNPADEEFIERMDKESGFLPAIYSGVFKIKRALAPYKSFRKNQSEGKSNMAKRKRGYSSSTGVRKKRQRRSKTRGKFRKSNNKWRRKRYRKKRTVNFKKKVVRAVAAPHTWLYEYQDSVDLVKGKYYFWFPGSIASNSDITTAWTDTGEGGSTLGNGTTSSCLIGNRMMTMNVKNMSLHDCFIKVYWLVPRTTICESTTYNDVHAVAAEMLVEGWKERVLDADETSVQISQGTTPVRVSSELQSLTLYMSSHLCEKFKIYTGKGGYLKGGEETMIKFKSKFCKEMSYRVANEEGSVGIKGFTAIPVIKCVMSMGHDTASLTEFMTLDGALCANISKKLTLQYLVTHKPLLAVTNTKDISPLNGLEAPTDMLDQIDE